MFYVRTADRLQRTSTWRDNLEGGLDYLKDVVVNDSLGLAAELEAQMQHVVDTYQCEWKTAVTNPDVRKRFRTFVNSDKADERIVFVEERGQIRPARPDERPPPAATRRTRHHRLRSPRHEQHRPSLNGPPSARWTTSRPTPASAPWWQGRHVAVFRVGETQFYAIDNVDPSPAPACCRGAWSATWAITSSSPRRSTRTTSTSPTASAWKPRAFGARPHPCGCGSRRWPRAGPTPGLTPTWNQDRLNHPPAHLTKQHGLPRPAEFVTKMVDAGESKLLMSTRDT